MIGHLEIDTHKRVYYRFCMHYIIESQIKEMHEEKTPNKAIRGTEMSKE